MIHFAFYDQYYFTFRTAHSKAQGIGCAEAFKRTETAENCGQTPTKIAPKMRDTTITISWPHKLKWLFVFYFRHDRKRPKFFGKDCLLFFVERF
jgi:hypothetical protein